MISEYKIVIFTNGMQTLHSNQIRFRSSIWFIIIVSVLQLCGGAKHYYYIHTMPILFFCIFENGRNNNRKQSRLYSIFFSFVLFLGKHAKLILCANKLRVNSSFCSPFISFALFYCVFSSSSSSFRRVSEFINIYFNKHTKSAVSVYVIFCFAFEHLSGALGCCLQRKQPVSSNSSWHY